jgi:hypothetical protein
MAKGLVSDLAVKAWVTGLAVKVRGAALVVMWATSGAV